MTRYLGWLDTNIFVHASYRRDPLFARCRAIMESLQSGEAVGWIDPLVIHELTYVLQRQAQFPTKRDAYQFIRDIVVSDGVHVVEQGDAMAALARWATQGVSFVDAWLYVTAQRKRMPVCSANRRDFVGVRNTFPSENG